MKNKKAKRPAARKKAAPPASRRKVKTMPPVGEKKEGERRIRFRSNVSYEGTDYGPDYDNDELSLRADDAHQFVSEGRAVYADEKSEAAADAKAETKSHRK